jgi:uncharacterized protein
MSELIKEQVGFLIQLQEMDISIHNIRKKMSGIPLKLAELEKNLTTFKEAVENETQEVESLKTQYRQLDSDIGANETKIRKSHEKLASVKNNKEYQATLKEIDDIKVKNSEIEDRMIELLDLIGESEEQFGSRQGELAAMSKENEVEKKQIEKSRDRDSADLKVLEEKRDEISDKIDPKIMGIFSKARGIVGMITISRVEDAICQGCNMNIPAQKYNEMQRGDIIHYCPNCHRIIYWKNEN